MLERIGLIHFVFKIWKVRSLQEEMKENGLEERETGKRLKIRNYRGSGTRSKC